MKAIKSDYFMYTYITFTISNSCTLIMAIDSMSHSDNNGKLYIKKYKIIFWVYKQMLYMSSQSGCSNV